MALVLKKNHPLLISNSDNLICTDRNSSFDENSHLNIGIYNIMPEAEKYELSLLKLIGGTTMQIEPIFIRAANHSYNSSNKLHIDEFYVTFKQAISELKLDGLIITGAPVEKMPFNQVTYADELKEILAYAQKNITSTMGICWGGIAIAEYLGMEKEIYTQKLCGVYESKKMHAQNPFTFNLNDVFHCPHSRYAGIKESDLLQFKMKNKINLLAKSDEAGYYIFETPDHRLLANLGHPEYDVERILFEYNRDTIKGLNNIPKNFNTKNPVNTWRENAHMFFYQWLQYIYNIKNNLTKL